jgi:hypothetical protein
MNNITAQYRRNVLTFYAWLGSVVTMGVSPLVGLWLIDRHTPLWRLAGVLIGAAGALPWMWVLFVIVRRGDEFVRRMHLVAIAIAAAASLVLLMTIDWLQRADFIQTPNMAFIWPACLVIWLVSVIATKRHFERPE